MKNILNSHRIYFGIYAIFFILASIILLLSDKQSIHLFFNGYTTPLLNGFYYYMTHVGDGLTLLAVGLLLLCISYRWTLQIALSGILSGLIAQLLKKVVFGPTPRPSAYFEKLGIQLTYIEGVELHAAYSFPSGHTTAVFALMTSLMLMFNKKKMELPLFILALLTGFSRIYLSQHFLADVLAGSFIGVSVSVLVYYGLNHGSIAKHPKLDQSLITLLKK